MTQIPRYLCAARMRAVFPESVLSSARAPCARRSATHSACPRSLALCKGVQPCRDLTWSEIKKLEKLEGKQSLEDDQKRSRYCFPGGRGEWRTSRCSRPRRRSALGRISGGLSARKVGSSFKSKCAWNNEEGNGNKVELVVSSCGVLYGTVWNGLVERGESFAVRLVARKTSSEQRVQLHILDYAIRARKGEKDKEMIMDKERGVGSGEGSMRRLEKLRKEARGQWQESLPGPWWMFATPSAWERDFGLKKNRGKKKEKKKKGNRLLFYF